MRHESWMTLAAATALCLLSGRFAHGSGYQTSVVQSGGAAAGEAYIVRPGDELEFQFFYNPELNEKVTVRPDGRVALALIGDTQAGGYTLPNLRRALAIRYENQLQHPEVNIIVRTFARERVFVDGEVGRPGMQSLQSGKTLMQAISDAGGAKDTGYLKEVKIVREANSGQPIVLTADVSAVLRQRPGAEDLRLQPNDIVFVPRTKIANVNVWVDQYLRKNIPITFGLFSNGF